MKNFKLFIFIFALPLLLTSCGGKPGPSKAPEKTQQRIEEPTHEELTKVERTLEDFWNDLSTKEIKSWNSDSTMYRRSVIFGYQFSKMDIKTKILPTNLCCEQVESIFLSFNQAIEEMGQPDLNSLAKKLLTKP